MALEFLKSAYDGVKERLQNPFSVRNATPFAGTFLITFVLYNWKLFYTLFNFDPEDTRADKIDIIQSYINSMNCWERVGCPLLWAFGAIIFYYLFNNLSLAVTVFFNRWVKGFILYITDRSRTVPREELDSTLKKMNVTRVSYEEFRRLFVESQAEVEGYKTIVSKKDVEIYEVSSKLEKKDIEIEELKLSLLRAQSAQDEFKVLYARYGKGDEFIDVTKKVQDDLFINRLIAINNETFSEDPCINQIKELFVLYSIHGEVKDFTVIEGEEVTRDVDNILRVKGTEKSKKNEREVYDRERLSELFKGIWILRYANEEGEVISQYFTLDKFGRYFVDGSKHNKYTIIDVNIGEGKIVFTKAIDNGVIYVKETLSKIEEETVEGVDSKGRRIVYSKYK